MSANTKTCLVVLSLILLAALPRFWQLGLPGFYGDEETSALAARSLAQGDHIRMPSGMPYTRALPQTYLNAASARMFGLDEELSYRLPAAILGVLTVPALFLLARSWIGTPAALVAAILLALSEWHVATSREARMYAPFLLFYLIAVFAIWRWTIHGGWRYFSAGIASFFAAMSFHIMGITAAVLVLLPLLFGEWASRRFTWLPGLAVALGGMGVAYHEMKNVPVLAWNAKYAGGTAVTEHSSIKGIYSQLYRYLLENSHPASIAAMIAGAAIGLWIARVTALEDDARGRYWRLVTHYVVAAAAGALTAGGRLYGAILLWTVFLAVYPRGLGTLFRAARTGWVVLIALAVVNISWIAAQDRLLWGVKQLMMYPFPYAVWFLEMFGAVFMLFVLGSVQAVVGATDETSRARRVLVLAAVIPIAGIGFASQWGGMRYLIGAYPFILLLAASSLTTILEWIGRRFSRAVVRAALLAGLVLTLSGVLGGHGLPQAARTATVMPGDKVGRLEYDIEVYPDHESAGRFVAQQRRPNDLVVAEDVLEQTWYAGRVDIALRDPKFYRAFFYHAKDGKQRDIYVDSLSLDDDELQRLLDERLRRIWIITSGEIHHQRERHLSCAQHAWLIEIEKSMTPVFIARDGLTKVYCLNCSNDGRPHS